MTKFKLTKLEKIDTYEAESIITLDGEWIGTLSVTYAYNDQNKLRVNEYWVTVDETHTAFNDRAHEYFLVDGRWETKCVGIWHSEYKTHRSHYKTAKAAKKAALAFITQTLQEAEVVETVERKASGIFIEKQAKESKSSNFVTLTPCDPELYAQELKRINSITKKKYRS